MRQGVSNLEDHLGYWLRCLSNLVSSSFSVKLEAKGVSVPQWVVMRTMYDRESLSVVDAARLVGVDKSTMSRMMERLESAGLVSRADGPDRRTMALKLTAKARRLVPELAKLADENDAEFFQSLGPKKQKEFLKTVKELLAANGWDASERGADTVR